ncbi:hypothetical protein ANCDUO_12222 [Ancylostoma duodenale]|uniref:G-protein coupled receptors family 1 profile domain-containing protein n=1 Tax=Ancylostoma duodenale TaxID=51022 RepID=A0A0C2G9B9_9BILA|nr:hypothetical protein ANCDUO_12222 [Ancylostoma duodenale]
MAFAFLNVEKFSPPKPVGIVHGYVGIVVRGSIDSRNRKRSLAGICPGAFSASMRKMRPPGFLHSVYTDFQALCLHGLSSTAVKYGLCRTCKFFDVFGIALSMNILICISLDRFYSIFFPLYAMRARKSVQKMVIVAWITSFATSAPQDYFEHSQKSVVQSYL